ncbi:hypothetical protein C5167_009439 [Papaver somniferum]|uniref:RNase III domain-containing protein n=1 Tax=Papaver somniferum TaxID=3469 RepID=A0A4Y7K1B6_PAPSO|nr:endoribonuclease Dicer homolog 4-like [Papaver somniferum]RZC65748.1 hypothetical protein C5167_009439 [Papaver somniferum]
MRVMEEEQPEEGKNSVEEEENSKSTPIFMYKEEIEEILGYKFVNKTLLEEAFTHPSFFDPRVSIQPCINYERLEFVGAAVLDLVIAKEMFILYPRFSPGKLSRLRAANVDMERLARVAIKFGLHRYIRYKKTFRIDEQIREFSEATVEYPVNSNGLIYVPRFLAHVVEAIFGAVFIDCNSSMDITSSFLTVRKIIKDLLEPLVSPETIEEHPMTELQEFCQKNKLKLKIVKDLKIKENKKVSVLVNDTLIGIGTHGGKQEIAQNRAARSAIDNLRSNNTFSFVFKPFEKRVGFLNQEEEPDLEEEEEEEDHENHLPDIDWLLKVYEVQKILGYEFNDKSLLAEAFTHPSFYDGDDERDINSVYKKISYERLEFIGDSTLNMLIVKEMYNLYPDLTPGRLTRITAANVDNEKLARVAIKYGFHHCLRYDTPHLARQIEVFCEELLDYPMHSNGLIDEPKCLADLVEATVGAVFIDSNFSLDTVWKVVSEILKPMMGHEIVEKHPMAELLEFCQKNRLKIELVKDLGNNNSTKRVDVYVEDNLTGTGIHEVKKEIAKNRAAKAALDYVNMNKSTLIAETNSTTFSFVERTNPAIESS